MYKLLTPKSICNSNIIDDKYTEDFKSNKEIDNNFLYIFLKNYNYSNLLLTGAIPFLILSNLNEIEIPEFLINKQRKIIDLYTLMEKEELILKNLMEKKKLLNKIIINKLLKGKNDY